MKDVIDEKLHKALSTDDVDYAPSDRTQDNQYLVERYSKKFKTRRNMLRLASAFVCLVVLAVGLFFLIDERTPPIVDPSLGWSVSAVDDAKDAYPTLLYPPQEFEIESCILYAKDNVDKYLIITYLNDGQSLVCTVLINGYATDDQKEQDDYTRTCQAQYSQICTQLAEINGIVVACGQSVDDAFVTLTKDNNKYLISLTDSSTEQLLQYLESFSYAINDT